MGSPDFGGGPLSNNGDYDLFLVQTDYGEPPSSLSDSELGGHISLAQNRPNPFALSTIIAFDLLEETSVSLRVFDASGRLVRTVFSGISEVLVEMKSVGMAGTT